MATASGKSRPRKASIRDSNSPRPVSVWPAGKGARAGELGERFSDRPGSIVRCDAFERLQRRREQSAVQLSVRSSVPQPKSTDLTGKRVADLLRP